MRCGFGDFFMCLLIEWRKIIIEHKLLLRLFCLQYLHHLVRTSEFCVRELGFYNDARLGVRQQNCRR
jgi:hypothetical protein